METFKVTVVVGTYNRINYLKKCLDSLLKLDFSECEIIIVNDGSADGTKEFLDSLNNYKEVSFDFSKLQMLDHTSLATIQKWKKVEEDLLGMKISLNGLENYMQLGDSEDSVLMKKGKRYSF